MVGNMKNILICAENLGSGGVETVIYNGAIALKKKVYNVIIIGKYRDIFRCFRRARG